MNDLPTVSDEYASVSNHEMKGADARFQIEKGNTRRKVVLKIVGGVAVFATALFGVKKAEELLPLINPTQNLENVESALTNAGFSIRVEKNGSNAPVTVVFIEQKCDGDDQMTEKEGEAILSLVNRLGLSSVFVKIDDGKELDSLNFLRPFRVAEDEMQSLSRLPGFMHSIFSESSALQATQDAVRNEYGKPMLKLASATDVQAFSDIFSPLSQHVGKANWTKKGESDETLPQALLVLCRNTDEQRKLLEEVRLNASRTRPPNIIFAKSMTTASEDALLTSDEKPFDPLASVKQRLQETLSSLR